MTPLITVLFILLPSIFHQTPGCRHLFFPNQCLSTICVTELFCVFCHMTIFYLFWGETTTKSFVNWGMGKRTPGRRHMTLPERPLATLKPQHPSPAIMPPPVNLITNQYLHQIPQPFPLFLREHRVRIIFYVFSFNPVRNVHRQFIELPFIGIFIINHTVGIIQRI